MSASSQRPRQKSICSQAILKDFGFGFRRPAEGPGRGGDIDYRLEAFQRGSIDLTSIRIPPDFGWAGCLPDQANDFMSTFRQVAAHRRPDLAM
jgi:hypothetical protein